MVSHNWPKDREELLKRGINRVTEFCDVNKITSPNIFSLRKPLWRYADSCAIYHYSNSKIEICIDQCGYLAGEAESRNWTWPASTTDREPYGVLAHELGHHCDRIASKIKTTYGGEYSSYVRRVSKESPITSYCPDSGEWFAEMFRLFVTNPVLLQAIRPKTYGILTSLWKPLRSSTETWMTQLGVNVPKRILRTLTNKGAK